jgi:putative restriction endonuclease
MAAFEHLRRLGEIQDHLTAAVLKSGCIFDGERIPLMNPQRGIFKPQQMQSLLSIKTVFPKPGGKSGTMTSERFISKSSPGVETVDYAFMGQNPDAADRLTAVCPPQRT